MICTIDPARAEGFWPSRLFPSYASIDRARSPTADVLVEELRDARFESVRVVAFKQPVRHSRDRALTLLRERFTSTFALLPEDSTEAALRVRSASCPPLASAASTSWPS